MKSRLLGTLSACTLVLSITNANAVPVEINHDYGPGNQVVVSLDATTTITDAFGGSSSGGVSFAISESEWSTTRNSEFASSRSDVGYSTGSTPGSIANVNARTSTSVAYTVTASTLGVETPATQIPIIIDWTLSVNSYQFDSAGGPALALGGQRAAGASISFAGDISNSHFISLASTNNQGFFTDFGRENVSLRSNGALSVTLLASTIAFAEKADFTAGASAFADPVISIDPAWEFSDMYILEYSIPEIALESNSLSAVPVPAAVWLFGSGLLGLVGMARCKKA